MLLFALHILIHYFFEILKNNKAVVYNKYQVVNPWPGKWQNGPHWVRDSLSQDG